MPSWNAPAPAVQVLNADALAFPWESLEGPWKIIIRS